MKIGDEVWWFHIEDDTHIYADNYEIMMRENKLKEVLRNFNIVSYKNEQS